MLTIDCISDAHGYSPVLPGGDILIVAGDISMRGEERELSAFNVWLGKQNYTARVLVAGNHDRLFQTDKSKALQLVPAVTHYLEDSMEEIYGLKVYGMPWTPNFPDWAFHSAWGPAMESKTRLIPYGIDVLVTHGPPLGILDEFPYDGIVPNHGGDGSLLATVFRVKPKVHVFGHIHEGHGKKRVDDVLFVNAAIMGGDLVPTNGPIRIQFDGREWR